MTGGTRTWYGTDTQGSVRQTLDDGANVLASQSYDPYGNPETSGQVGIFGYTGELQDGTTNAEYLRARWYQPGTGTLLGVDAELDTTGQAYAYAGDDPANGSDPGGEVWGWNCDRGGPRIDAGTPAGNSGLSAHDLAESAYLDLQGTPRRTCELEIPYASRKGPGNGFADVVDDYRGNDANLWELEPIRKFKSPGGVQSAHAEARGYIQVARNFPQGASASTSARGPGGITLPDTWSGPRSFLLGSQQAFRHSSGGLGVFWPGRFEPGRDGYWYTVLIGVDGDPSYLDPSASQTDGVMWFLILRWQDRSRQPTRADAPTTVDIPYYMHIAKGPPGHTVAPWSAAADEVDGGSCGATLDVHGLPGSRGGRGRRGRCSRVRDGRLRGGRRCRRYGQHCSTRRMRSCECREGSR